MTDTIIAPRTSAGLVLMRREMFDLDSEEDRRRLAIAIEDQARESAAQVAETHAERLKHTSHRDGLGMGWLAGEEVCHDIAARIRNDE